MASTMIKAMTLAGALAAINMLQPGADAGAQAPPAAATEGKAAAASPASPLAALAWLEGCWRGDANKREFREHWLPLRGDLLVGVSHMVDGEKTVSYEYLRVENRADGVYYVVVSEGTKETALKLVKADVDGENATLTFANPALDFPRQLSYRRQAEGWLFVTLDGKVKGADRQVIYPMHRIGCETGAFIRK